MGTATTEAQVDAFEANFKAALKDIRAAGVKVRQNVPGGTIGSIEPEALGMTRETEPVTPYLFSYGGQGGRYVFRNGLPYNADQIKPRHRYMRELIRPSNGAKVLYFYHGGPEITAARVAAEAFRAHGLDVVWDGTAHMSVMIRTPFFDPERDRV